jgi:16S rRNA A1518/A1519 N6-dimethyltransferase RsmA/KsgA/DIM1 with predicted DNA glycosylase/AP lyase activity
VRERTGPAVESQHRLLPLVLAAVPPGCQRAPDVGCGDGMLAPQLACRVPLVVGIDQDAASIEAACGLGQDGRVDFVRGDFLTYPFPPASFGTSAQACEAADRADAVIGRQPHAATACAAEAALPTCGLRPCRRP